MDEDQVSLHSTECCGIREADGIQGARSVEEMMLGICQSYYEESEDSAFIFFSCTTKYQKGEMLQRFIKKNNLGEVVKMGPSNNPNSGNNLKMFMWQVDQRELKKYYKTVVRPFQKGDRVELTVEGKDYCGELAKCKRLIVAEVDGGEVHIESTGHETLTLFLSGEDLKLIKKV